MLWSVVPAAFLVTVLLLTEYWQERRRLESSTTATARALAIAVDQQVAVAQASLMALGSSRLLRDDIPAFREQAIEVAQQQGFAVIGLVSPGLEPLMNTLQLPGAPLQRPGSAYQVAEVFARQQPIVTDVFEGSVLRAPAVAVAVPVLQAGEVAYALVGGIDPAAIGRLLREQRLPQGWVVTVADRSGRVVARSSEHDRFVGAVLHDPLATRMRQTFEGSVHGKSMAGIEVVTFFSTAKTSGWRIVISIPQAGLTAGLLRQLALAASGTMMVLLTTLLLAWRLGQRLVGTVEALKEQARQLGRGEPVALVRTRYLETEELSSILRQASVDLRGARQDLLEKREQLEHSESRLAGLVESTIDAIVSTDEAHTVVLFNRAAERLFGWDRQQVLGQPLELLVPPRYRQAHLAHLQRFAASGTTTRPMGTITVPGLRADGSEFPMEASISQVATATGKLLTAVVRDMSDKVRAAEQLTASRADASAMREADKKRVARELHDDVVQTLAAMKFDARWLLQQPLEPELALRARRLISLSDDCVVALRRIAADLRPAALDELGFAAALEDLTDTLTQRTGLPCELRMDRGLDLQDPHATEVFRLVQEALSNVAKHAQATRVWVELERLGDELLLRIRDDGIGFDTTAPRSRKSMGLAGLRERVELLAGTLSIDSRPGAGTTVEVRAPAFRDTGR